MSQFNFTYYEGRQTELGDELRIRQTTILIGLPVWKRLGSPEHVEVQADRNKAAIKLTASTHGYKLAANNRKNRQSPNSYTFSVASLSRELPQGNYYPLPDDPSVFVHDGVVQ